MALQPAKFKTLAFQWKAETGHLSSATKMAEHPAYRKIVEMGKAAIPLILEELEREPGYWFCALRSITGADPVPEVDRGKMRKMAGHWLRWGRERGYLA